MALAALTQGKRLAIFCMLLEAGPSGLPAGTIATRLNLPASSLSFRLANLTRAGLLAEQRHGRSRIYSADFAATDGFEPVTVRALAARRKRHDRQDAACRIIGAGPALPPPRS
jgi:DNA-binding transcriptional ArsR family regulator